MELQVAEALQKARRSGEAVKTYIPKLARFIPGCTGLAAVTAFRMGNLELSASLQTHCDALHYLDGLDRGLLADSEEEIADLKGVLSEAFALELQIVRLAAGAAAALEVGLGDGCTPVVERALATLQAVRSSVQEHGAVLGKLTVVPTEQLAASSVLVNAFSAFLECRAGHVKLYSTADTVNSPRAWARFGQVGRLADEARRLLQIAVEDGLGDWRLPREEAAVFTRVLDEEAAKRRGDLGPKRAENFRELLRNLGTRSCWREVEGDDAGIYQLLPVGLDWAAVVTKLASGAAITNADDVLASLRPLCCVERGTGNFQLAGVDDRHRRALTVDENMSRVQVFAALALTGALMKGLANSSCWVATRELSKHLGNLASIDRVQSLLEDYLAKEGWDELDQAAGDVLLPVLAGWVDICDMAALLVKALQDCRLLRQRP